MRFGRPGPSTVTACWPRSSGSWPWTARRATRSSIGTVLEARYRELGCSTTKDDIGNIVAVYPGTRPGTILVSTHMDTAGTDRGIVPIIGDDGVIRTDGSTILGADDKSGLAGCLELLRLLQCQPRTGPSRRSSSCRPSARSEVWSAHVIST